MQPKLEHLSSKIQKSIKKIIAQHTPILARNKHQLGYFKHFQVTALIDDKSKINCKQPCRTRILPASCKADINTYKDAGLFEPSTGRQDTFCANITLVRRSINKSLTKATKADKYIQRQIDKTVHDTLPIDDPSLTPATYRMTIDFRHLNRVTLNDHSTQLPSVQSIIGQLCRFPCVYA